MLNLNSRKILKHFSYICFILSPVILLAILSCAYKQNAFVARPLWSDEIGYWREIYSFAHYGFNTGYIGINELTPKFGCFSTHGFFPALLYFPFAKVLNWAENGIVIANMLFTFLCFYLVILVIRPQTIDALCLTILFFTFPAVILYVPTSMTELINYGLLSLFFAFFYKFCISDGKTKKACLILTLLVGTACCFYRIIYVVLFFAPIFAMSEFRFNKKFIKLSLLWALYSGGLYYVNSVFTAPYPFGVLYSFTHTVNTKDAFKVLCINFKSNVKNLISPNYGSKIEVYFRLAYLLIAFVYFSLIFIKISINKRRKNFISLSIAEKLDAFYVIQFAMLFLPLIVILIIYDVYGFRDFRALSPFLWASIFSLVVNKRRFAFKIFVPVLTVLFICTLNHPEFCMKENVRYAELEGKDFTLIQTVVKYDENAENPFENTLATDNWFNFELWSNLHPGIGIQWLSERPLENLKSKYLLLNTDQLIEGYEQHGLTDFGCLYVKN